MKTMTLTGETSGEDVARAAGSEGVVLVRDNHAVAIVVPFDDDLDWYARERDPAFLASVAQACQQVRDGRTRSHEQLVQDLGLN